MPVDIKPRLCFGGTKWLVDKALPYWSEVALDRRTGSFVDRLSLAGEPLTQAPRRSMSQARQVAVLSVAASRDWYGEAGHLASLAWDCLLRRYWDHEGAGGWAFSCNENGMIVNPTRDLYAQAFCLFACAHYARVSGDRIALTIADSTIKFLDKYMKSSYGGYHEEFPQGTVLRRQNPHMHLLEAFLELHSVDPDRGYLERAMEIVNLATARFIRFNGACLVEYFNDDWTTPPGDLSFEPGHHMEWSWLLHLYGEASGVRLHELRIPLEKAAAAGISKDGLFVDEVASSGTIKRGATRLWPQCEAARLLTVSAASKAGSEISEALSHWERLEHFFLSSAIPGCWLDHFSDQGELLVRYIPASSLYHLVGAIQAIEDKLKDAG